MSFFHNIKANKYEWESIISLPCCKKNFFKPISGDISARGNASIWIFIMFAMLINYRSFLSINIDNEANVKSKHFAIYI